MIRCAAYAKVNLALEVLGRRSDGYHEILSVIQAIDLHDDIVVEPADGLVFDCSDPSLAGDGNLVLRAAFALQRRTGARQGARIHLHKRIPVAAGLGGGSSDAAATLLALGQLWGLALSDDELDDLAAGLGSDVPYFLRGGTALVSGRGERVRALRDARPCWIVLLRPRVFLAEKTASLYRRLAPADFDDGAATRAAASALEEGRFPSGDMLVNTFEKVAFEAFVGLERARQRLYTACNGRAIHLAGAGPTLFSIFANRPPAERAWRKLQADALEAYLARVGPWRPTLAVAMPGGKGCL